MEMENNGGQMRRRLVLVPFPSHGHVNPMLQLATMLHSMGFSITIAHPNFNFPNPSSHHHPQFRFLPLADGLSDRCDLSSADFLSLIATLNINCRSSLRRCLLAAQESPSSSSIAVIYDGLMYFSQSVAADLRIPSLILRTSSVATSMAFLALPRLHRLGLIPPPDSTLDGVPELDPLRFKDLPLSNFMKVEGLLELVSHVGDPKTSSATIYNTMDFLEQSALQNHQQHYKIPVFPIGPFHKLAPATSSSSGSISLPEDTGCLTWLDKHSENSVIYVSFGSMMSITEAELIELAWGLADSEQPFLWVIRPGMVRGGSNGDEPLPESFRERIGDRGCIVKWAPQKEVLAHRAVGGFLSHCGWNSTLESVCEGVPVICRPVAGDQRVNARYLSHVWGVGLELENGLSGRGEVERVVRRLMVGEEGEERRRKALELKEKAEVCKRDGGSSYGSLIRLADYISSPSVQLKLGDRHQQCQPPL